MRGCVLLHVGVRGVMLLYFIVFEKGGGLISRLSARENWYWVGFIIGACIGRHPEHLEKTWGFVSTVDMSGRFNSYTPITVRSFQLVPHSSR
ncbi:hypothetical protein BOTNAR_0292g00030 [Botryotinia narcissicola]|uniref:Uncharacterized protein n=1 Tax=Botryotinia narcissicola TaxID=278944 RepID=A0A4Z1HWZ5_9HELO|nr:hypothetical protein BOTNAR_0292g00030 [Botryotinia narcissicola]